MFQKEFIIDGVSTTDSTKICNSLWNYFIDHPKNIHESNPFSNSHHLDQIDINDGSMYFCVATETEIVEFIMQMNREVGLNHVCRKFHIMCKNHVSHYFKELFNFCIDSLVFPNVFKISQITPIHKQGSLRNISSYWQVSVLNNLSKVFENLLYNRLQSFLSRIQLSFIKSVWFSKTPYYWVGGFKSSW